MKSVHTNLKLREVGTISHEVHGGSWMGLLETDIFPSSVYGCAHRTIVDSTLRFEVTQMRCDWETFVFLALGLGIDVRCGGLQQLLDGDSHQKELQGDTGQPLVDLYNSGSSSWVAQLKSGLLFSWRRAFAVACVILTVYEHRLCFIALADLAGDSQPEQEAYTKSRSTENVRQSLEAVEASSDLVTLATTWTLYLESIYYTTREHHHVPQWVHYARDIALHELQSVQELPNILESLFVNNTDLIQKIKSALQYEWSKPAEFVDGKRSGWCHRETADCPGYVDIRRSLSENPHYEELLKKIDWHPWHRAESVIDVSDLSSPHAILARVILCVSIIQCAAREEMFTILRSDGTYETRPSRDPLLSLLWDDDGAPIKNDALIG